MLSANRRLQIALPNALAGIEYAAFQNILQFLIPLAMRHASGKID
jgi:hypothetical protein